MTTDQFDEIRRILLAQLNIQVIQTVIAAGRMPEANQEKIANDIEYVFKKYQLYTKKEDR